MTVANDGDARKGETTVVFRGRGPDIRADRAASARLVDVVADGPTETDGEGSPTRAVRVWAPHRQVAFGRRDARLEGYARARELAESHGFPPVERSVGGRAVAYDGTGVLAVARAEPVADFRRGTDERYERLTADVRRALDRVGLETNRGEPDDSFCPGSHSLSASGTALDGVRPGAGKVVGIAQRVTTDAALVSGVVHVDPEPAIPDVLEEVYGALDVPFDRRSVGSLAGVMDNPIDVETVRTALEEALTGDGVVERRPVDDRTRAGE